MNWAKRDSYGHARPREERRSPLDLETLLDRYQGEMGAAIIDPRRLKGHVLTLVERLFPDQLDIVEARLRKRRT